MSRQTPKPSIWAQLDRYLIWVSGGVVAMVWLVADYLGHTLSEGAKAAMVSWVGYAALKEKTDRSQRRREESGPSPSAKPKKGGDQQ